jgi:predicted Zn-dependent protease with MMP-like domain
MEMPRDAFERLVSTALDRIPPALAAAMDNVVVFVLDDPPSDQPSGLLGVYEGIPLTERGATYAGALPDRINIYMNPILAISAGTADVVHQVEITVAHEIAHHFGIDDETLNRMGYG